MPNLNRPWSISLILLLTVFLSCSDGGTTDPPAQDEPAIAVISGPDQVALGCFTGVEGVFNASQSSGPINAFSWAVDGETVGAGSELRYTFQEIRDYSLTLKGLNASGSVVASETKTVSVTPPTNLPDCLSQTRIVGKEGVLLRTGQASVATEYRVNTAAIAQGAVESYTWTLTPEGGDPETVAEGADTHTVQVTFSAGGAYELTVDQALNGSMFTQSLPVKVYTGEPVSEPGTIVFFNSPSRAEGGRSDEGGIFLMDGETGHVTGPIIREGDGVHHVGSGGVACYGDRVVFTGNADPGDSKSDLWEIHVDGTGLRELVDAVGILQHPDVNPQGDVAVIDDTRWNFDRDELAIYYSDGVFAHASGNTVDEKFNGLHPSWSSDGAQLALGANPASTYGTGGRRIAFFNIHRSTHTGNLASIRIPEFPYLEEDEVVFREDWPAWDPRDEFIAYHVNVYDTLSMDPVTFSFDTRYILALWSIGTNEITILREDQQAALQWSPSGAYLLFHRYDDENGFQSGIWQIPREGGEPVNLSAITLDGAMDWLGGFCKGGAGV